MCTESMYLRGARLCAPVAAVYGGWRAGQCWLDELWTLKQMGFLSPVEDAIHICCPWSRWGSRTVCFHSLSLSLFRFIWTLPPRQYSVSCCLTFDNFTGSNSRSLVKTIKLLHSCSRLITRQRLLYFQILTGLNLNFKLLPRKLTSTGVFMALF